MTARYFTLLDGQDFMNIITLRKSGAAVPTPVWFAEHEDRLYIYTGAESGKVKRIRNNNRVEVQAATASGRPLGDAVAAEARLLDGNEAQAARQHLKNKYGLQFTMFRMAGRLRPMPHVFVEVSPPQ